MWLNTNFLNRLTINKIVLMISKTLEFLVIIPKHPAQEIAEGTRIFDPNNPLSVLDAHRQLAEHNMAKQQVMDELYGSLYDSFQNTVSDPICWFTFLSVSSVIFVNYYLIKNYGYLIVNKYKEIKHMSYQDEFSKQVYTDYDTWLADDWLQKELVWDNFLFQQQNIIFLITQNNEYNLNLALYFSCSF